MMTTDELTDNVMAEYSRLEGMALAGLIHPGAWVAVRISTDGSVYESIEPSQCYSEDEYYRRVPHNLTAKSFRAAPWNGDDADCPVDDEGKWHDIPDVDDFARNEVAKAVAEWIEAGNLTHS